VLRPNQRRQAPQGLRIVEIADQRPDARGAQSAHALGRRGERHQRHAPTQIARHALADVAAADDQETRPAKARRQRAGGAMD